MREVVLFIAMSLDGYIADEQGGVEWLRGQDPGAADPDSYADFIRDVDTVVMGWNTYHQIMTELSPEAWVYEGLTSYIVTHRSVPPAPGRVFTAQNPCQLVRELRRYPGKRIWVCGGAGLSRQLMEADLIDVYDIPLIPVLLGGGIRLFEPFGRRISLRLERTMAGNGITELVYTRRA